MSRRTTAAAILFVWFVALGWLVRREYFRPAADILADAALNVPPGAAYFRVELDGQQVGFASSKVDTLPDEIRVQDWMLLRIPVMGSVQRIDAHTEASLTRSLRLRSFRAGLRGEGVVFGARGTMRGDTLLVVEVETGGSRRTIRVPLDRSIILPGLLPLQLAFGGELQVGRAYTLRMFDPTLLDLRDVHVRIVAESTIVFPDSAEYEPGLRRWVAARWDTAHAWKVRQEMGGVTVEVWIDALGQLLEATTPVGFTLRRTAYEIAFENFRRADPAELASLGGSDVIRQTAIASNVALRSTALRRLAVRLKGVDLAGFDLSGGRQTLLGDTLIVRAEGADQLRARWRLGRLPEEVAPDLRPSLEPEPLIQSDDPRIAAQARQIVGREANPARVARRLTQWVYEALDKQITVSVPSAVDVLESRRGDCNEHTVLYVALARALGLPARTAAGLVYLDGRFYYHAWPEVYLDGWVAVDPTFGQFPADAAHLRFTLGGLARQVELIRLIGHLSLDVVAVVEDE